MKINKSILLISLCAFLILIVESISYAYFTVSIIGNESAAGTIAKTGTMLLKLHGNDEVNLESILPGLQQKLNLVLKIQEH